jgi:hypothetical protein
MALVTCPECGAGVSEHAAHCPHCGYPIAATPSLDPLQQLAQTQALGYQPRGAVAAPPVHRGRVQTVEQTGKFWKSQMLLSALTCIAGVIVSAVGYQATMNGPQPGGPLAPIGVLMVFAGLLWFIFARIGAWWNHG